MKCDTKIRYKTARGAKSAIRRRLKGGDVTAAQLQAYFCAGHNCYHIGNRSTALKYMTFRRL